MAISRKDVGVGIAIMCIVALLVIVMSMNYARMPEPNIADSTIPAISLTWSFAIQIITLGIIFIFTLLVILVGHNEAAHIGLAVPVLLCIVFLLLLHVWPKQKTDSVTFPGAPSLAGMATPGLERFIYTGEDMSILYIVALSILIFLGSGLLYFNMQSYRTGYQVKLLSPSNIAA